MYYSIYANERLAIANFDYYNECNWLLFNLLTKHYEMSVDEMVDFYLTHRHERFREDDTYVEWNADELMHIYHQWVDYENRKMYHEDYLFDWRESGEDIEDYINTDMAFTEFEYDDYMERISRFFRDKSFVRRLKSGEPITLKLYDWVKEDDEELADKIEKRIARNKRMKTKLREVNEVVIYKSDLAVIERVKRDYNLTELQTQAVFGLIFMSRMNGVKYCRIGTDYRDKGFWRAFDKHISIEDRHFIRGLDIFERFSSDKRKARVMLDNSHEKGFAEYLHVVDEDDVIYKHFDIQDEVAWVFHTTVENNRLNFSQLAREAMPNLKNRYCTICGKEFTPSNNKQRQCSECREQHKREQARLRKQKQRAIERGTLQREPKKKKLTDKEWHKRDDARQMHEDYLWQREYQKLI